MKKRLSLSQKISRLQVRLHDREWRRYGTALLAGKMLGVGLLLLGIVALFPDLFGLSKVLAADPDLKGNDIVNPLNTVWTLIAAFLVFAMQVGFTMLEAGFCRSRETVNVLMECIVDTCLCGLLFFAFGFAFMFSHGNGLIGMNWFFLDGGRQRTRQRGSHSWRFGYSNLRSQTHAPRLRWARWLAERALWVT